MTRLLFLSALGVLTLVAPLPASAQSLFSAGGLGVPTTAPDGYQRMLGGQDIGLRGGHGSFVDPASSAGALLPGIALTMEASSERFGDDDTTGRTRFPSFGIVYPYGRWIYSLGYTGFLSQEWRTEVERQVDFGLGTPVEALDRFEASGGIGRAWVGLARNFPRGFSAGVAAGGYLGALERRFERFLDPVQVGPDVEPFATAGRWRAEGGAVSLSAGWQPSSQLRAGVGVIWSGDLTLDPVEGTPGAAKVVPLPLEWRGGVHATLATDLMAAASLSFADWGEAAQVLEDEKAPGQVLRWGTGLEWTGTRIRGRRAPLSLGYRSEDLPFSFGGAEASERALVGGVGMHLSSSDGIPTSQVHVALERGERQAAEASERFFRATVTFRISGR